MTKARLTVTYVYEYEINPDYYEDCNTDEERMNLDIKGYVQEPTLLDMKEAKSFEIKGELIEEEGEGI